MSLILLGLILTTIPVINVPVVQAETLVDKIWVYSNGTPATSHVSLEFGKKYKIVAREMFWYDYPNTLQADAMYYTTNPQGWQWTNWFPAPDGHSFLQINGQDIDWGPFSNGDTGHTYTIEMMGEGDYLTFQIIDWYDFDYENNECHLVVYIYEIW